VSGAGGKSLTDNDSDRLRRSARMAYAVLNWDELKPPIQGDKVVNLATNGKMAMLVALTIAGLGLGCEKAPPPAAPPEVFVAPVTQQDVPVYLELVGQTLGYQDVDIRARIEGFLETVNFREGSFVRSGDLLYQIDRKPLEATLAAAKAEQATAEANLAKANNDVQRYTPLVAKQAVSQQELDDARSAQAATHAQVEAAKAAVEKASLDLGYARVASPLNGLVGTTLVKPGNLVGRGESTLLTTISQIDPIKFRTAVTEADYLRLAKRFPARIGAEPVATNAELTLADGSVYAHRGKLSIVDRAVDPTTGTLSVEFLFPNPDFVLRPGQYGKVRQLLETKPNALLIPQRAVMELQNLYSVAIVDSAGKVAFKNVKVGPRVGPLWVIEDGLKPGESVVVEGLQKIKDGATVSAKPAAAETAKGEGTESSGEAK
jgi:membrane fusion protein (multidrug efflux system)